jgi:hypothetical protein
MNAIAMIEGGAPTSVAPFGGFAPAPRADLAGLQYLRASGLAQARLQLAVLSGNRRRALREIDRLVEIDRQLENLANSGTADENLVSTEGLEAHLASQKHAIAGEKLALAAAVTLPTLPSPERVTKNAPAQLGDFEVVEDRDFGERLLRIALWLVVVFAVVGALSIAVPLLAAG